MSNIIDSLCMTWRHDYGLHKPDDDDSISSGMTTTERESLRRKMAQIHAHHIAPLEERIRELERASQPGSGEDTTRLDFMASHAAWIAWGKDGESCRVFHRDDDGDATPIMGWKCPWFGTARDAIDAARASLDGRREEA